MLRNLSVMLIGACMLSVLFISGCGSSESLGLKFSPEETTAYKVTTEVIKDYRFEQPTLDKLTEEQTKNALAMEYSQTVQSVDENGDATIKITINGLKIDIVNKNESQYSFDSHSEKDKDAPMAKLLGKSYTIKMTPAGKVEVVDTKEAMAAVTSSYEKRLVNSILDPKSIVSRHEITALPKDSMKMHSVKGSWSEVVASPPGLLSPKSFEKVYTLTKIKDGIATVEMVGTESTEPVKAGSQVGGLGMFSKMFDNKDNYTGSMRIDLATGKVLDFEDNLISTYTAQEMPENGDPAKGPDMLTMRFTNLVKLEKLN